MNVDRIKQQVIKAISLNPTTITLYRNKLQGNGMRGGTNIPEIIASFDVFIDDSSRNLASEPITESGRIKTTRGLTLIAVAEGVEIKEGDFFEIGSIKYKVTYPGLILSGIYNADLEVVR